ncbi:MAG: hypothetical protein KC493_12475, partial [Bacteriovoracaceae bacterium]|nr:hypothetical protein [Bacteriovoracaceae bacterium]
MKMSSLRTFILIFGLLLFGSCAKKGKKETKLKFTLGALFIADGDAMLWGKNMSNGESFGEIISLAPVERDLSFGQWNFYVTAWGGGENVVPLSGKAICDFKSVMIDDSAGVPEVSFNLENAKCALPAFGPSVNTLTTDIPSTLHY